MIQYLPLLVMNKVKWLYIIVIIIYNYLLLYILQTKYCNTNELL